MTMADLGAIAIAVACLAAAFAVLWGMERV
jgi:hypothetical protein